MYGNPDGGQASHDYFTIAWHRPSGESGQNGAIVGEVLAHCLDWLECENNKEPSPRHRSGIGYTIAFGDQDIPFELRLGVVKKLLKVCSDRLEFLHHNGRPKPRGTREAIDWLKNLNLEEPSQDLSPLIFAVKSSVVALKNVNPDEA